MEEEQLQDLVERAAGASAIDPAWHALWGTIEPTLWALVDRPRFASHLAHTEAARQRIVTAIHARLAADHCHELSRYLEARRRNPRLGFTRWLRSVAKRVALGPPTGEPAEPVRRRSTPRLPR